MPPTKKIPISVLIKAIKKNEKKTIKNMINHPESIDICHNHHEVFKIAAQCGNHYALFGLGKAHETYYLEKCPHNLFDDMIENTDCSIEQKSFYMASLTMRKSGDLYVGIEKIIESLESAIKDIDTLNKKIEVLENDKRSIH